MPIRLPDPVPLFAARAARLRRLADGHAAQDWLRFLALIADGQRVAAAGVEVPRVRAWDDRPPLPFDRIPRDASWRRMLSALLAEARGSDLPEEAHQEVRTLAGADAARLEELADLQLACTLPRDELAAAPFVGGALQTWFGVLASRLDATALRVQGSACPACGAPPVAGYIDAASRRRYLSCSLCGVDWNVARLTCVSCGEDSELAYFHVDGDVGAKAEACSTCGGYVKLFDVEKRPGAEPVADDAATLALDLLVTKAGFERIGSSQWLAVVG
jgi:FdhE protein